MDSRKLSLLEECIRAACTEWTNGVVPHDALVQRHARKLEAALAAAGTDDALWPKGDGDWKIDFSFLHDVARGCSMDGDEETVEGVLEYAAARLAVWRKNP